jgi:hypothetical protein
MRRCRFILPLLGLLTYIFLRPTKLPSAPQSISGTNDRDERERRIAEAAYYRSQRRGFTPGSELADWVAAEQEVACCAAANAQVADTNNDRAGPIGSRR